MPFFLSLKQAFGNLRIKHKVIALISLIMTFCFLITYFALQYVYSIYDEQLFAKSSQVLNLSSNGIEEELRRIERLSFNVATDAEIQGFLQAMKPDTPSYELLRLRANMNDRLVQYAGYEKNIYSVEIVDLSGHVTRAGLSRPITGDSGAEVLRGADQASGGNVWSYPINKEDTLIAARQIRSYRNLELSKLGTLLIRVRLDRIVDEVLAGTELKNGEIVIAAGDTVVYPLDRNSLASSVHQPATGSGNYLIQEMNGEQYFYTHVESPYTNWTYTSLIPFESIFRKIIWMKNILLVVFVGSLLAVLALAISFARSITRPMESLIVRMKQVQMGNFTQIEWDTGEKSTLQSMDEVGHLNRSFRIMVQQINELITENYAKQLTIKETQFKALQAQINPHFMYNTLESINWLAKVNRQPVISKMVESLGFLLRSSISMRAALIPLREELEIVGHYVTIQKYRFEERLEFQVDVPEEVMDCCIPKLSLQPLIENAINYALEPKIEPCRIRLAATLEQDYLVLSVEDDGPGMDHELLDKVRRGEMRRGSGIGLRNIEERIVLSFGEDYGLILDSEPYKGTKVTVRLPYERGCSHA